MPADWVMKRHDLSPSIQATLYVAGLPADLTGAASVKFTMTPSVNGVAQGAAKVNANGLIVSAASGVVKYDWVTGDTDTVGDYFAEWVVTWVSGSKQQTFPSGGYHTVSIVADLDNA